MQFQKFKRIVFCGLAASLFIAGCSRNVASVDTAQEDTATQKPLAEVPQPQVKKPSLKLKAIQWQPSLDAALATAKLKQKPVMIDFFATWCGPCKMLDQQIYPDSAVVEESANFISVKVDVDIETAIAQKYNVSGLPTIVFLDPSGQEVHRQSGIDGQVSSFVELMQEARAKSTPHTT